ncbi:MAG: hypothetical protein IKW67_02635 [Alphaproteobacteria bacterium]|nr:hypothetical protein [Alphaproteobacteria bacterium]
MAEKNNINQDMVYAQRNNALRAREDLARKYLKAINELEKYKTSKNIDPVKLKKYEEIVENLSKYAPKEK